MKKGFDVLEEIDAALKSGKGDLGDLSSRSQHPLNGTEVLCLNTCLDPN